MLRQSCQLFLFRCFFAFVFVENFLSQSDGFRRDFAVVQIDVPEEHTGSVMESMGARKGEMIDMINNGNGQVRLIFNVPSRGLIGYSTEFLSSQRTPSISLMMTSGFDTCSSKPSRRMFSIKIDKCSSPRPDTTQASGLTPGSYPVAVSCICRF